MTTLPPTTSRARAAAAVLALALAATLLWTAAAARPAAAATTPTAWSVAPAPNAFGTGRDAYTYTLGGGGRIEDGLEVVNRGDAPLGLTLRPADAVTDPASGRLDLAGTGARGRGIGAWVHLQERAVTVEPGATLTVPFVVTPPRGAAAGDHVGGIVTTTADGRRAGLQIRLRVSGALRPQLAVRDVHVYYDGTADPLGSGGATISYTIANTGNTVLSARQAVSASAPFGSFRRAAARLADSPALLPGATWRASAPLRDVTPALRLRATVAITPLLIDAAGSTTPLATTKATGGTFAIPWTLVALLVLTAGLVAVAARRLGAPRRRRRPVGGAVA